MRARFWLMLLFLGCATKPPLPRSALIDQRLSARPGDRRELSNTAEVLAPDGKTLTLALEYQDLTDPSVRETLFRLRFICSVGGRLFKVCPDKPGFCRVDYKGVWPFRKQTEEYVDIVDQWDFVVAGRTTCISGLRGEFDELD